MLFLLLHFLACSFQIGHEVRLRRMFRLRCSDFVHPPETSLVGVVPFHRHDVAEHPGVLFGRYTVTGLPPDAFTSALTMHFPVWSSRIPSAALAKGSSASSRPSSGCASNVRSTNSEENAKCLLGGGPGEQETQTLCSRRVCPTTRQRVLEFLGLRERVCHSLRRFLLLFGALHARQLSGRSGYVPKN